MVRPREPEFEFHLAWNLLKRGFSALGGAFLVLFCQPFDHVFTVLLSGATYVVSTRATCYLPLRMAATCLVWVFSEETHSTPLPLHFVALDALVDRLSSVKVQKPRKSMTVALLVYFKKLLVLEFRVSEVKLYFFS